MGGGLTQLVAYESDDIFTGNHRSLSSRLSTADTLTSRWRLLNRH